MLQTGILQIKTEILNTKTGTIQITFLQNQHENETIKINIQILNLKRGTIKKHNRHRPKLYK